MTYDPFERGPNPVGVLSVELSDRARSRTLPVEVWYPASDQLRARDLDPASQDRFRAFDGAPETAQAAVRDATPASGRRPLIIYSHGATGHRRDCTHLVTHLASHGYVVAAIDHVGNTMGDLVAAMTSGDSSRHLSIEDSMTDRPADVSFTIDRLTDSASGPVGSIVDGARIGMCGVSFGGWTTLAATVRDGRIAAALPIVPAWGKGPVGTERMEAAIDLREWRRPVPTLLLAAERDSMIMLPELQRLFSQMPEPKRMVTLLNAGHVHFNDNAAEGHDLLRANFLSGAMAAAADADAGIDFKAIGESTPPFSELCSERDGALTVRAVAAAHMDAELKSSAEAKQFRDDLAAQFAARGIKVEVR